MCLKSASINGDFLCLRHHARPILVRSLLIYELVLAQALPSSDFMDVTCPESEGIQEVFGLRKACCPPTHRWELIPRKPGLSPCGKDSCLWLRAGLLGPPEVVCLLLLLLFFPAYNFPVSKLAFSYSYLVPQHLA